MMLDRPCDTLYLRRGEEVSFYQRNLGSEGE